MKSLIPGAAPFDAPPVANLVAGAEFPHSQSARLRAVDRERDRRIAAGFTFQGVGFQTDPDSVKRIAGAASAALVAITIDAAAPGDLRWADPDADFVWIAADNSLVPMDAPSVIAFGKAYMAHERALVFAAKAIKDRIRTGESVDVAAAPEWP